MDCIASAVALFDPGRIARACLELTGRFLRRNDIKRSGTRIVVMPCIVGVSRDDGFVSRVSLARFPTAKIARSLPVRET